MLLERESERSGSRSVLAAAVSARFLGRLPFRSSASALAAQLIRNGTDATSPKRCWRQRRQLELDTAGGERYIPTAHIPRPAGDQWLLATAVEVSEALSHGRRVVTVLPPASGDATERRAIDRFISVPIGLLAAVLVRQISEIFGVIRNTSAGTCHCSHKKYYPNCY